MRSVFRQLEIERCSAAVECRIENQSNWKEINEWTVNSAAMFVVIACESRPRRHRASVHHHKLRVEECSSVYVYKISLRRAAVNMWMQNSRSLQRVCMCHRLPQLEMHNALLFAFTFSLCLSFELRLRLWRRLRCCFELHKLLLLQCLYYVVCWLGDYF